jgi:uncharacterized protein (DUF1697 family)
MQHYAAFLRGVGPTSAQMPALRRAFERAGFTDVRTLLSSGNLVFTAKKATPAVLQKTAEEAMQKSLGKTFLTVVRSIDELQAILGSDPYKGFHLADDAKRVVTFLREPPWQAVKLPVELEGARILKLKGNEAFTAYTPTPKGPVFMTLIEKTFGKAQTTLTWQTVEKVAR